jgi:hypothetical protein
MMHALMMMMSASMMMLLLLLLMMMTLLLMMIHVPTLVVGVQEGPLLLCFLQKNDDILIKDGLQYQLTLCGDGGAHCVATVVNPPVIPGGTRLVPVVGQYASCKRRLK